MVELMFGNPLKAFAEGSELSQQMQRSKMQTEAQGMQNEAAGMALQQAKWQMPAQEALYNLSQKENQTQDDYTDLLRRFPVLSDTIKPALSSLTTEQQQAAARQLSGIVAAMNNGRFDVAYNMIGEAGAAQGNAGNKQGEKVFRDFGDIVKMNPRAFQTASNLIYSQLDPTGFQNVLKNAKSMSEMAAQQQELEIKQQQLGINARQAATSEFNARSEAEDRDAKTAIDREKNRLDQIKTQNEAEKSKQADPKVINDFVLSATDSSRKAEELSATINQFGGMIQNPNMLSTISNFSTMNDWKAYFGNNKDVEMITQAYRAAVSDQVREKLKSVAGSSSDKDMAFSLKGSPNMDDLSPKNMIRTLVGAEKGLRLSAAYDNAKAEWAGQNGNLGVSRQPLKLNINGQTIDVPAGTSFTTVAKAINKSMGTKFDAEYRAMQDVVDRLPERAAQNRVDNPASYTTGVD